METVQLQPNKLYKSRRKYYIWKQKVDPFIRLTNIPHLMAVFLVTIATLAVIPAASALNTFCPNGCVCNDETLIVQCEKSKLDVLPIALNPSIQRLVLRNNKIKTVDAAFQFYGELQYVDLSSNHLVNIPTHCFTNQKKLQELHLNRNKISSIRNVTFQGLKSLTVLNLRENFLEVLTRGLFTVLPKLEELNLGQNRISKIDPLAFEGMTSLRILYLDDNQLMSIPTSSFAPLGSLAELHVGLNVFTVLSDDAFAGLGKLTVLDIGGAGLVNISDGAFNGLSGLRNLDLADNHLHVIPTKQLAKLTRLEELSIGQNDFISIKSDSFRDLANLRHLDITSAGTLERVEQGAFSTNVNLESIILASNKKLNIIEDGALTGLPKLRRLVLRENSLELISESTVAWSELRALELSDNPLNCDCNLLWLRSLVAERNMTNVQCATPLSVRDRSLKSLSPEEMGCAFHDPHQQAILGAVCVSGVALLAGLSLLLYRYRRRVRDAFKDYKWNKRAISRKEHEYQKTFSDDEYMVRSAAAAAAVHQQHPNHLAAPPSLKPIPVTEL